MAEAVGKSLSRDRITIIMPVYNEAETIERTIREIYDKILSRIDNADLWVFEDGSTDGTKEILKRLEKELPRLHVRMAEERKGYPRAMKEAFLSIDPNDYHYVLSLDSDGQYEPNDFFKLWGVMWKYSPDIVMGRRIARREPLYRRILSRGLNILERLLFKVRVGDVTSVMRLMRVETSRDIVRRIRYSKYNFWLEFTVRAELMGYSVIEVPISYRERLGSSRVYSVKKMPKVVLSELRALMLLKAEQYRAWEPG